MGKTLTNFQSDPTTSERQKDFGEAINSASIHRDVPRGNLRSANPYVGPANVQDDDEEILVVGELDELIWEEVIVNLGLAKFGVNLSRFQN